MAGRVNPQRRGSYGIDAPLAPAFLSAWAGQTVQLEFASGNPPSSGGLLDNIRFSPVALVPEPSIHALFGLGAAALLWSHRRQS